MPNVYLPCKDGYVVIMAVIEAHWRRLMEAAGNPDWGELEVFATAGERARNWDALEPLVLEWTMSHTGEEIARLAQERGVPCFPAYTVGQMMESPHVAERGFLQEFTSPGGRSFQLPGHPIRMSATPWRTFRPAPRLGQHTVEVLGDWLGRSGTEAQSLSGAFMERAGARTDGTGER
jgi:crotonobetainyl-CoA:carnitine CoA-transferase CaiB-like acyl-CoA transferase